MRALERAARALFDSEAQDDWDGSQLTWDEAPEEYRQHARRQARAVLMAVREPGDETGGAVDVGYETMRHREVTTHKDARVCFTAMIDAILGEGEGE